MRKLIATVLLMVPGLAFAAGAGIPLERAPIDLSDRESLQRGASLFVNYCAGCHSADYMRYNRIARDLGIPEDQLAGNLMFATSASGEPMHVAMSRGDATEWFGKAPPDLSVTSRSHGANWLYTFLRTFYVEEGRPFGVNNATFKDVGMPHVLWELQGFSEPVMQDGLVVGVGPASGGKLSAAEYDRVVTDLVAFMVYLGEPIILERKRIGVWVLLFLAVFMVLAILLKKEYWRDVH